MFLAFLRWLKSILCDLCHEIAEGCRQRDGLRAISNFILLVGFCLSLLGGVAGVWWLVMTHKNQVISIALIIAFILHFAKKDPDAPAAPPAAPIEAVKKTAEDRRPIMRQGAFALFNDLRLYVPNLPTVTLDSVEADPPYIISPTKTVIYQMKIMKVQCDVGVKAIWDTLEGIIGDRIRAKNLPFPIEPEYPISTGEKVPGLVVHGVHDIGTYYRVELAITDDAEAAIYIERHKPRSDGLDMTGPNVHDPDFD